MSAQLQPFPLRWPEGQPRKAWVERRNAAFKVTLAKARDHLSTELRLLDASNVVITANVPVRRDGTVYASVPEPLDPGVAVYFTLRGRTYVFACDAFYKFVHNLRAIGLTVQSFRAMDRYGATEMLEQALTAFAALPPAGRKPWHEVLSVSPNATAEAIQQAFKRLAVIHHPDASTGNAARMTEINAARDAGLAAAAGPNGSARP